MDDIYSLSLKDNTKTWFFVLTQINDKGLYPLCVKGTDLITIDYYRIDFFKNILDIHS